MTRMRIIKCAIWGAFFTPQANFFQPIRRCAAAKSVAGYANIFDISGDMRTFFRKRLFYLGVDPQRIMGGLDGLCSRLAWQYSARIGLGAAR